MATTSSNQKSNTVFGKIIGINNRALANLKVTIYDVDISEWQALAEGFTTTKGKYELQWRYEQLSGRVEKKADIGVKVFTKEKNTELFKSSTESMRFNASDRQEINITFTQALPKKVVEFDFLVKEVTFLTNKIAIADLQENEEHQDLSFLSKELENIQ